MGHKVSSTKIKDPIIHLIQEKLKSHLKESMNTYPELMLENLKMVEYSKVKLGCTQPVLLQQLKRWSPT